MKKFLDKTFTLRQILQVFWRVLFAFIPIYICLVFFFAWKAQGDINYLGSPYSSYVPEQCRPFTSVPGGSIGPKNYLLFKVRNFDTSLNVPQPALSTVSPLTCLGYTVLGGIKNTGLSNANFTQNFKDSEGRPIVTVHVEYP